MGFKADCRYFRNDKPCKFGCGCEGCSYYEPMGARILIIKLDAIGDVARTTTLLEPLIRKHAPCHITWLVAPVAEGLLRDNPRIDVVLPYCAESLEPLRVQRFDLVLSLDKTPRATAVAMWVDAPEKRGFGLTPYGTVHPLNPEAEYAFVLGLDDELKFRRNRKTHQEVVFECCKLPYNREEYALDLGGAPRSHADDRFRDLGIVGTDTVVGLNLGGGSAFANKMWSANEAVTFVKKLRAAMPCKVLLFGAARETDTMAAIVSVGVPNAIDTGTANTIPQFQAMLGKCDVVVTGDSLGMHLAIAEKRPVVALFGPTCAQEIEFYGRGEAVVTPKPCAPCYRRECAREPTCMEAIDPDRVVAAVKRWTVDGGKQ